MTASSSRNDRLVIDVGMHNGDDTAYYLAKGFDVVGVEANPQLVAAAEQRFAAEIEAGRLRLVSAAVAEENGTMPMAISDDMTIWSSLSNDFVRRNERYAGTEYHYVDVPTRRFEDVLAEVGVPYYLKVDIEGFDMLCVRALRQFAARPAYVSIESNVSSNDAPLDRIFDELAELWSLGYRGFKYVNQRNHPSIRLPSPPLEGRYVDVQFTCDVSGPFGEETPGSWQTVDQALSRAKRIRVDHNLGGLGGKYRHLLPARAYGKFRQAVLHRPTGWYDLHARHAPVDHEAGQDPSVAEPTDA
jgi:FkbM family methyltransferase